MCRRPRPQGPRRLRCPMELLPCQRSCPPPHWNSSGVEGQRCDIRAAKCVGVLSAFNVPPRLLSLSGGWMSDPKPLIIQRVALGFAVLLRRPRAGLGRRHPRQTGPLVTRENTCTCALGTDRCKGLHSPPCFGNVHCRRVVMSIAPCSGSTPGLGQLLLGSPIQGGVHSAVFFEPGQPFRPLSLHPPQGSPGVPGPRSRPIFHWVQPAKNASSSFLWVVCQFCRIRFSNVFFLNLYIVWLWGLGTACQVQILQPQSSNPGRPERV